MAEKSNRTCQRCGTCCKKGGPGLHQEDRGLVDSGKLPGNALFTIRAGELVRDNVKGILVPLDAEMIKIKGVSGRWTCMFYDEPSKGCTVYENRPLECRALNCRDTTQIEAIYARSRLTRKHLLANVSGLWDLIEEHEKQCNYKKIKLLVDEGFDNGIPRRQGEIFKIMRYDAHLRQLTQDRAGVEEQMLDFLFGRPLSETIKMFGVKLEKNEGRFRLVART